jgi:lycopene beta-cyclase
MFGPTTYLIWLALFVGIPLLAMALTHAPLLWRRRRALAWVTLGCLVGGWGWDVLAVQFGLWHFEDGVIVDVWFLGLPLEEWLWIVGTTLMFSVLTLIIAQRHGLEERP